MLKRFLQQRGMRKLLRDRMAVGSLVVIGAYLLFALSVLALGLIPRERTTERIGPMNLPGFWQQPPLEKRLQVAEFYVDEIRTALEASDREGAVANLGLAEMAPATRDPAELDQRLETIQALLDDVFQYPNLSAAPEALPKLEALEEGLELLWEPLEGGDATMYAVRTMLGTDRQGRSILVRGLYAIKVAVQIGIVCALVAVLIGALLGGAGGYFGGWVDAAVVWLFSTFSSIPWIVLLLVLASMFQGSVYDGTLIPVYCSFCMTFWIAPCRVIRGEVMKIKQLEYVQAASAVGFGRMHILLRHVLPNTAHLMFINFSLLFIGAIKAEVILSFLGLGVKNEPSWGIMIDHARQEVLNGFFWQIGTATALMVVLVLAFNVLSDALQDAFDPRHVG